MKLNRYLAVLLGSLLATASFGQTVTRFPYNLTFRSTAAPAAVVKPAGTGTNSASFTNQGLLLTNSGGQFGAVLLNGAQFNSTNGLEISFEYSMYNGTPYNGVYGDGICVFLYDASVPSVNIGAAGAGLGYAYNRTDGSVTRQPGLSGAYLGIGLDEFGNFRGRRFQSDSRVNGIDGVTWGTGSHVTLRGAMHPDGLSGGGLRGLQYSGYPVLITQSTKNVTSNAAGMILNPGNGDYNGLASVPSANAFGLRSGTLSTAPGDANYRRVTITLLPNPAGGYNVTVKVQYGVNTTTVINNYYYPPALQYYENANAQPGGFFGSNPEGPNVANRTLTYLDAAIPNAFKIGFGASTGGASQNQLIRDLVVKLPYQPIVAADVIQLCGNYTSSSTVNPYTNDLFYNGPVATSPTSGNSSTYINYSSFVFENASGTVVGTTTYTDPNKGTWTYNTSTGMVTFTALSGFIGTSTIYYSAKGTASQGGPYNQDIYRSETTPITATVVRCNTISNPQLPSKRPITSGK